MMRYTPGILFVLAALTLGVSGCSHAGTPAAAAAPQPIVVSTAAVQVRQVPHLLQASGSFIAGEQSQVAPPTPGLVTATPVQVGDFVQPGQTLARLDDRDAQLRLQQAQTQLAQAQARLGWTGKGAFDPVHTPEVAAARASLRSAQAQAQLAQSQLKRYAGLVETGDISHSTYDQARTQADTAQAQAQAARQQYETALNAARQQYQAVLNAQAQLALARKAVADTVVRAPFAGYVSQRPIAAGEHVGEASAIVTLVKLTPIKLDVQVPESEAPRLHPGLGVDAQVAGFHQRTFHGTVTAISPAVDPNSRTLLVEARFANQDRNLHPGMFATVSIVLPGMDTALFVPPSAILNDTSTDSRQLYVADGKQARLRVVQTGEQDGDEVRILNGLKPGDQVITQPQPRLFDGAPIAAQPAPRH